MQTHAVPKSAAYPRGRISELLAHAPIFRDLSPDELARIAAGTREVRADRGQILFQRGDPCEGFHIVVFGQVKLTVGTPAGAEKVVDIMGPGASFGEALMFTERPYVVSATALADSLLLHVGKDTLFDEIARDPKLARRMLAGLSWRLHMLVKDVEALTLHSATQRVIGYLARLQDEAGPGRITLPAQKSLVASRLNLTPEYFSRILHELEGEEIIRIEGRDIEIVDPARLAEYGSQAESA
ncbi:MAG TPA: Crp/Fnr family transcriptional regulator [Usitatibacter sp.]|nr:Crp/Fnr family transcriptional regulator [Usitatibacter sp.]